MCVPPHGGRRAPRSKIVQEGIDAMKIMKIKKVASCLLAAALLAACQPSPAEEADAVVNVETGTPGQAATAAPAPSAGQSVETDGGMAAEAPTATADEAFRIDGGLTGEQPDAPLPVAVTVRESYEKRDGAIRTTFRNHTLDFAGLLVELTGLVCDGDGTTVSLAVTYPEAWTSAERHSMSLYMGFAFATEQGDVGDFYKAAQSPLPEMAQADAPLQRTEYRFHSATLTPQALHGCSTLTVTPFVDYFELLYGGYSNGREDVLLAQGESCVYNGKESFYDGVMLRRRMEELSLSVPLPEAIAAAPQAAAPEPVVLPVTCWEEDWEENLAHGYYGNYAPFFYGTLRNESADFSGLTFALESALVWDGGYRIVLKVCFPPAWDGEQRRTVMMSTQGPCNTLNLSTAWERSAGQGAGTGGPPEPNETLTAFYRTGFRRWGFENRTPEFDREFYYVCEGAVSGLSSLLAQQALTATLVYRWWESFTFGETTVDLTTGEPYYVASAEASFPKAKEEQMRVLGELHIPASSFVGFEEMAALAARTQ